LPYIVIEPILGILVLPKDPETIFPAPLLKGPKRGIANFGVVVI
jgi:hypothetical protein